MRDFIRGIKEAVQAEIVAGRMESEVDEEGYLGSYGRGYRDIADRLWRALEDKVGDKPL